MRTIVAIGTAVADCFDARGRCEGYLEEVHRCGIPQASGTGCTHRHFCQRIIVSGLSLGGAGSQEDHVGAQRGHGPRSRSDSQKQFLSKLGVKENGTILVYHGRRESGGFVPETSPAQTTDLLVSLLR